MSSGSGGDYRPRPTITTGAMTALDHRANIGSGVTFNAPTAASSGRPATQRLFEPAFIETDFTVPLLPGDRPRPATASCSGPPPPAHHAVTARQRSSSLTQHLYGVPTPSSVMSHHMTLSPVPSCSAPPSFGGLRYSSGNQTVSLGSGTRQTQSDYLARTSSMSGLTSPIGPHRGSVLPPASTAGRRRIVSSSAFTGASGITAVMSQHSIGPSAPTLSPYHPSQLPLPSSLAGIRQLAAHQPRHNMPHHSSLSPQQQLRSRSASSSHHMSTYASLQSMRPSLTVAVPADSRPTASRSQHPPSSPSYRPSAAVSSANGSSFHSPSGLSQYRAIQPKPPPPLCPILPSSAVVIGNSVGRHSDLADHRLNSPISVNSHTARLRPTQAAHHSTVIVSPHMRSLHNSSAAATGGVIRPSSSNSAQRSFFPSESTLPRYTPYSLTPDSWSERTAVPVHGGGARFPAAAHTSSRPASLGFSVPTSVTPTSKPPGFNSRHFDLVTSPMAHYRASSSSVSLASSGALNLSANEPVPLDCSQKRSSGAITVAKVEARDNSTINIGDDDALPLVLNLTKSTVRAISFTEKPRISTVSDVGDHIAADVKLLSEDSTDRLDQTLDLKNIYDQPGQEITLPSKVPKQDFPPVGVDSFAVDDMVSVLKSSASVDIVPCSLASPSSASTVNSPSTILPVVEESTGNQAAPDDLQITNVAGTADTVPEKHEGSRSPEKVPKRWNDALCLSAEVDPSVFLPAPCPAGEEGEERDFVWDDYLEETKSTAAPATSFKHVECSLQSGFVKGMLVEVANRSPADTYWVASVVMPCGQLLRLRPVGCDDASRDFWRDVTSSDIHPIGWCCEHDSRVCPPDELSSLLESWQTVLEQSLKGATTPPSYMLDPQTGTLPIDQIKEGMYLEAQLDLEPDLVWPVKVIENVGGRLLLRYEGAESASGDFWLFYLHYRLHPIGWARSHDCAYRPPDVVKASVKQDDFDWTSHASKCLAEAEKFQPPPEIFMDQITIAEHSFKEGTKLEALHPTAPSVIRPVTVKRVVNRQFFIVELDDARDSDDDHAGRARHQLCGHAGSTNIFPVGWCSANGLKLEPVPGLESETFVWSQYLAKCQAEAADEQSFVEVLDDHEFETGMKLEAVNPSQPGQICVATILRVVGNRLLKLCLDHQVSSGCFYYAFDSDNIFPIGWCESNQYQLKAPVMRVPAASVAAAKAGNRKVAVVQPERHLGDDARTALYQQLKEADSKSSNWCPKIYFNYRCFTGPYLSKGRIVLLPQSVGPGPVVLVMKEVLSMLINVAYKSSRVLRELQLEGPPNPSMHQQLLHAKYKGKSYSAKVEICRSGNQVESFCRDVCMRLECCPNLVSPRCLRVGEVCPDNCAHLSKTKFTNYYKKQRRKIGRPPGGHSNMDATAKRPGGRRKRHRKIVLTLRKKHGSNGMAQPTAENGNLENDGESGLGITDEIGDYEIDAASTASDATSTRMDGDDGGNRLERLLVVAEKRKRRHEALPVMEMKTRGAKRYRFEKRTHQKVLHVSTDNDGNSSTMSGDEVSPCQLFSNESMLKLDSNPLYWSVRDVVEFIKTTDCAAVARLFHDQEIDGQSLMLLSLPTIQEHMELKLGPAVKLCHQIERVKIAFYEQFAE